MNPANTADDEKRKHAAESAEDLIYSNDHARVTRRTLTDGSKIIVKQALGIQAIQRLANEVEILKRLRGVAGVTQLADVPVQANTLALHDDGGTSLSNFLRSGAFTTAQWIDLALGLAQILANVHKAGVLHKDISPDNILISVATRQPTLIDFNIAVILGSQIHGDQKSELAGTLPYMSPEQTGRSGRSPDQRSDLYSLGVTLYEVATRRRPFTSDDMLELIHDHLVRIPEAPCTLNQSIPEMISALIMRLLEKDPDKRYQSAEGLAHDLLRIRSELQSGKLESFELGAFDFGARLAAPARLIGRDTELAVLRDALARTGDGRLPCLMVSGVPGVGKSALLAELKSLTSGNALCVFSKFDQYKQDSPNAALDIFRALARQLLAGSEEQLAQLRATLRAALGNNLGVGPSALAEFKLLLGDLPTVDITDANEAEARTAQAALAILRSIAKADAPLVLVMDDMQWAPAVSLRVLDAIVTSAEPLPGLLLVCGYRVSDAGTASALEQQIDRWKLIELAPPELSIDCLSATAAIEFIAHMLRLPIDGAAPLGPVLAERTGNNPYNLVEVINALRQDGLLAPAHGTWEWDAAAIRRHVGNTSVADLLSRRIGKLPAQACELLQMVACLGGDVDMNVLALASGLELSETQKRLAPSTEDGLLVLAMGDDKIAVRFASGRVQEAVIEGMDAQTRAQMHLGLARRIAAAATDQPQLQAVASEQYLPAAECIELESERRVAVDYFEQTAKRLRLLNGATAQKFLSAAVMLLRSVEQASDKEKLFALECELHRALYGLGRFDEVDALWESINRRAPSVESLAEPTRIQMYSLNNRKRFRDSMEMGVALLAKVGLSTPADIRPAIGAGLKRVAEFSAGSGKTLDFERAEATDSRAILLSNIVPHTTTPAYYADPAMWAWLSLEAQKLWMDYGPSRSLLSGLCSGPSLLVGMMQDYKGAFTLAKHIIAVGDHRRYQPSVSYARTMCGISASHWFEPLQTSVDHFRQSLNDLVSLGDESFFLNNFMLIDPLFDYSPTLDAPLAELELGFSHANRIQQMDFQQRYRPRKQFIYALRGATKMPCSLEDDAFDEAKFLAAIDQTSVTGWVFHVVSGMMALIFGDIEKMTRHAAAAMPLNARAPGYYMHTNLRLIHGIALCEKARTLPVEERAAVIEEFDKTCLQWMTARAADAPMNFLHLQKWLDAERAWAMESIWKAGIAFEDALAQAAQHDRPWHRAVLTERAARFHLSNGLESSGRDLISQAFEQFTAWGAAGKVKELRRQHAFLRNAGKARTDRTSSGTIRGTMVDTDMVDMMAVLRASQALSSETNLRSLTLAVGKVLGSITGATRVQLVVKAESGEWVMAQSLTNDTAPVVVEEASAAGELPYSVFKYAERTAQVLVSDDLVTDERFSSDPYVEKFNQCSMMLVPVLKQGQLNGMLVLENEQRRGAFSADRLDSVAMIAGQLSVSLDNALLYASLEKRVAERTAELRQKTADINAMLQNMPQGVLTVVRGNVVHAEYSAYLTSILESEEIAGRNVMSLLFVGTSLGADVIAQADAAIAACIGEDAMNYDFNAHLLPTEFDIVLPSGVTKSLALSWSPIVDDSGVIDKLMICVRDVTELRRLESEANARKRELQMIGEILAVSQEKFKEFMDGANSFVDENTRLIEATKTKQADVVALLFRNMHTIKGNARTFGLLGITNLVHTVEHTYDQLRKDEHSVWDPPALLKDLVSVRTTLDQYAHINDAVLGRKGPSRRAAGDRFALIEKDFVVATLAKLQSLDVDDVDAIRAAIEELGSAFSRLGFRLLQEVLSAAIDSLPSLAKELEKAAPNVVIVDHGLAVRSDAGVMLRNLFTHLLRNAVDHGIEKPSERRAKGKEENGTIEIVLEKNGGKLVIRMRDDGRGLAIDKIRRHAVAQGLLTNPNASAHEVAQLIFKSGFSTAEAVTEVSGRGVGMDAVRGFLSEAGGSIDIQFLDNDESAAYRTFETIIYLPHEYATDAMFKLRTARKVPT